MLKGHFKQPKNKLELEVKSDSNPNAPKDIFIKCEYCKELIESKEWSDNQKVCKFCGYHDKIGARERILKLVDEGSFSEYNAGLTSVNLINFPDYEMKLNKSIESSKEQEAVITGQATISGISLCLFAMESRFMMGSMGQVVGEKITRLFEYAMENNLPVVGFTLSGGARMHEGMFSLMQMAKTSGAVKAHSNKGLLYIVVLCNPTTGGVTASFAMLGDILIAEPNALIGFAGPRVIEQITKQSLPDGFQKSESVLNKGMIDMIVERANLKEMIAKLLKLHNKGLKV